VVALLHAVGSLRDLSDVRVQWHLWCQVGAAEAQQVSGVLDQLLPCSLVPCCRLYHAHPEVLGVVTISLPGVQASDYITSQWFLPELGLLEGCIMQLLASSA
jgi:hypothetical protein